MFDKHVRDRRLPRIYGSTTSDTRTALALAAGFHPKIVSERLGRSMVAFTMDVNSHAIPADGS
jgi:hypothetical protein